MALFLWETKKIEGNREGREIPWTFANDGKDCIALAKVNSRREGDLRCKLFRVRESLLLFLNKRSAVKE